MTVKVDLWL